MLDKTSLHIFLAASDEAVYDESTFDPQKIGYRERSNYFEGEKVADPNGHFVFFNLHASCGRDFHHGYIGGQWGEKEVYLLSEESKEEAKKIMASSSQEWKIPGWIYRCHIVDGTIDTSKIFLDLRGYDSPFKFALENQEKLEKVEKLASSRIDWMQVFKGEIPGKGVEYNGYHYRENGTVIVFSENNKDLVFVIKAYGCILPNDLHKSWDQYSLVGVYSLNTGKRIDRMSKDPSSKRQQKIAAWKTFHQQYDEKLRVEIEKSGAIALDENLENKEFGFFPIEKIEGKTKFFHFPSLGNKDGECSFFHERGVSFSGYTSYGYGKVPITTFVMDDSDHHKVDHLGWRWGLFWGGYIMAIKKVGDDIYIYRAACSSVGEKYKTPKELVEVLEERSAHTFTPLPDGRLVKYLGKVFPDDEDYFLKYDLDKWV